MKLLPDSVRVVAEQDKRRSGSVARPADAMPVGDADAVEDYSEVQWESPSTSGVEEVMNDLEKFRAAMAANTDITVGGDDEGGEWL